MIALTAALPARADDLALNICLAALGDRKDEVAELKKVCAKKGELATKIEVQRDKNLPSSSKPPLEFILLGASAIASGAACTSGKNELCIAALSFTCGEAVTIFTW